jgi:hypothetical protein
MRNLLEQLKPEIIEVLETEKKQFPYLVANIENELKTNYSWLNLSINNAQHLCTFNNTNLGICEIASLFLKNE